eukprot:CAMPEP_0183525556 /NCGR_PEP_ID=MMETSP0371-20130417/20731_1 /TAXON_ID=268820 /ORGANISM="Peridinium aciculiferum, Strain PAER-2" /LENGTH=73 /DNA_ID=CAMNT_0025724813 /DNA_START=162 /DNA_END=381 /DNA_ORIENTATION=-
MRTDPALRQRGRRRTSGRATFGAVLPRDGEELAELLPNLVADEVLAPARAALPVVPALGGSLTSGTAAVAAAA